MAAGEDAERGAGIAHVSQAEQTIDDRDRVVQRYCPVDDDLGQLLDSDNQNQPRGDARRDAAPGNTRGPPPAGRPKPPPGSWWRRSSPAASVSPGRRGTSTT